MTRTDTHPDAAVSVTRREFATWGTWRDGLPYVHVMTHDGARTLEPCAISDDDTEG